MLDKKFFDRTDELNSLEERFHSNKPELIVIYGKRRVGKTELVKQFFKNKQYLYLLGDKRSDPDLLRDFTTTTGKFFDDIGVEMSGLPDWVTFFKYLQNKIKNKRTAIVVDEFPYLVNANKAIPSLFQKGWDEYLQYTNTFMILMGSSISMMERGALSYSSPLYGRRTGQMMLQPLTLKGSLPFFSKKELEEQIEFYSVLGGMPAYLLQFSENKTLLQNIRNNILRKDAFLYNEVEFVLREELKEPKQYFTILKEIAFGRTKVNELSQATGLERNILSRYLSILENLRIIKREVPVTEKHPDRSRKGLYKIDDNYFKFWFEFVFPNRSSIEKDETEFVMDNIEHGLNRFIGHSFEEICRQLLWELLRQKKLPFTFTKVGKWWYKGSEIDIVALNEKTDDILFIECKWQSDVDASKVLNILRDKVVSIDWNIDRRKEYFAVFAKHFKRRTTGENIYLFDLEDIKDILNNHTT